MEVINSEGKREKKDTKGWQELSLVVGAIETSLLSSKTDELEEEGELFVDLALSATEEFGICEACLTWNPGFELLRCNLQVKIV